MEKPGVAANSYTVFGVNKKQNGYYEGAGYLVSQYINHLINRTYYHKHP